MTTNIKGDNQNMDIGITNIISELVAHIEEGLIADWRIKSEDSHRDRGITLVNKYKNISGSVKTLYKKLGGRAYHNPKIEMPLDLTATQKAEWEQGYNMQKAFWETPVEE